MRFFLACISFLLLGNYNGIAQYVDLIWKSDNESPITFSPEGQLLLTKSKNSDTLFIREIPNMEVRYVFITTSGDFTATAFSPNGNLLATTTINGAVQLWDIKKQEIIFTLNEAKRDTGNLYASNLAFSPDGNNLAFTSYINAVMKAPTIWVWNLETHSLLWKKAEESGDYISLQYIYGTNYLYVHKYLSNNPIGNILNAQTGNVIKNTDNNYRIYSPNGKFFSIINMKYNDNNITIYNAVTEDSVSFLPISSYQIYSRVFSPNGDYLIISDINNSIERYPSLYLWEVKSGKGLYKLFGNDLYTVSTVSSNSKYFIGSGGLYSFSFPTSVEEQPLNTFPLSTTPNPASAQSLITFTLLKESAVRLSLFDATGREVLKLFSGEGSFGENHFSWNTENLPQGVYFIRLEADGKSAQVQCAVVR